MDFLSRLQALLRAAQQEETTNSQQLEEMRQQARHPASLLARHPTPVDMCDAGAANAADQRHAIRARSASRRASPPTPRNYRPRYRTATRLPSPPRLAQITACPSPPPRSAQRLPHREYR